MQEGLRNEGLGTRGEGCMKEGVSISLIFPLPNHSSQIFFRDITNDAKKR